MLSCLRNRDIFGHPIKLNFDKKGDSHKTVIGGFFSMLVQAFFLWYIIFHFRKIILKDSDVQYTQSALELEKLQPLGMDKT